MTRHLLASSLLLLAVAGCGKPGAETAGGNAQGADTNVAMSDANTIETTGAPASVGSYGPGLVATPVFVEQAAQSDMYEIAASKLALTASKSSEIKDYAKEMVSAHETTTAELKKLVVADKLASPPAALDAKHQRMIDDLKKAEADKFDKLYLDQQTSAHREALGLMNSYAANGENAGLKSFADRTKPKIQHHLDMASTLDHGGADEAKSAG